jgi:class 3 adenylate cyclase
MMIVIGENTFEQVKELFECRSLGKATLKGKQNEVSVYEVVGAKGAAAGAATGA